MPPILTREFFMADRRRLRLLLDDCIDGDDDARFFCCSARRLWYKHRNEPGCVVGAHIHILLLLDTALFVCLGTDIDCRGEVGLSIENLIIEDDDGGEDGDDNPRPKRLSCEGDDVVVNKGKDRGAKFEDDKANAEEVGREVVVLFLGGGDATQLEAIKGESERWSSFTERESESRAFVNQLRKRFFRGEGLYRSQGRRDGKCRIVISRRFSRAVRTSHVSETTEWWLMKKQRVGRVSRWSQVQNLWVGIGNFPGSRAFSRNVHSPSDYPDFCRSA